MKASVFAREQLIKGENEDKHGKVGRNQTAQTIANCLKDIILYIYLKYNRKLLGHLNRFYC